MFKKISTVLIFMFLFTSFMFNTVLGEDSDEAAVEGFILTIPSGKIGDIDGDKEVNSIDAAILKRYIIEAISKLPAEDEMWVADVNGDEEINSIDYALISQYILHYTDQLPKEERNDYIQVECGISHT